ncbi:MAG: hypothetical protein M3130_05055 [Actinomycetota bacterium]|nr:hypothetical protein [Actinomycetota bacterium]
MHLPPVPRSRTAAVAAGAAVFVLIGGTGAIAASQITSEQIKDHTIRGVDIANDTVTSLNIHNGSIIEKDLSAPLAAKINANANKMTADPNWGVIDRNVIGNGDAYLRFGPTPGVPMGVGSLGIRTGSGTDKAAFGNQTTVAGQKLSDITNPHYSVYASGEDLGISPTNLPSLAFEINPHTARTYSTLVYVPTADTTPGAWMVQDGSTTTPRWYFTGGLGQDTSCNQVTYCTFADAKAKVPDATLISVQITKGRDNAFSGAVDKLEYDVTGIGTKTYNFEPDGVFVN